MPIPSLVAAVFASATALAGSPTGLEGVWLYQGEVDTDATGRIVHLPGPTYEGMLIYTADGYVSATLMPTGRTWTVERASLAELRGSISGSSTAYAGRYQVDAKARTVTHQPRVSLDPADANQRLVRTYALDGDTLALSGPFEVAGQHLRFTVRWVRAPSSR